MESQSDFAVEPDSEGSASRAFPDISEQNLQGIIAGTPWELSSGYAWEFEDTTEIRLYASSPAMEDPCAPGAWGTDEPALVINTSAGMPGVRFKDISVSVKFLVPLDDRNFELHWSHESYIDMDPERGAEVSGRVLAFTDNQEVEGEFAVTVCSTNEPQ